MFNWFINLNYIYQALIATLFICFFKKISKNIVDVMLGFVDGVMTATSYFSLLAPAIEHFISINFNPWLTTFIFFFWRNDVIYC